jgi:hypothetical protein
MPASDRPEYQVRMHPDGSCWHSTRLEEYGWRFSRYTATLYSENARGGTCSEIAQTALPTQRSKEGCTRAGSGIVDPAQ